MRPRESPRVSRTNRGSFATALFNAGWESSEQLERALETYDLMSRGHFIHASPTLFHAGLKRAHLSSCFLLGSTDDSIEGIYKALGECARISKAAGGIGLSVADVRAAGSKIKGTGG